MAVVMAEEVTVEAMVVSEPVSPGVTPLRACLVFGHVSQF